MNDVSKLKFINTAAASVTGLQHISFNSGALKALVSFAASSNPQNLMTTNNVAFSPYPDFSSWRAVFSVDRCGNPIFVRGGVQVTAGYNTFSCQRTNPGGFVGCGQPLTFGFVSNNCNTCCGTSFTGGGCCCGQAAAVRGYLRFFQNSFCRLTMYQVALDFPLHTAAVIIPACVPIRAFGPVVQHPSPSGPSNLIKPPFTNQS